MIMPIAPDDCFFHAHDSASSTVLAMNQGVRLLIGVPFVIAGVVFRPFWHSEWGMPTFILIFWITMSLGAGWGGKGKPYSLRFGLIFGTALSLCLVATVLINKYVGIGLILMLLYVAIKSKFFENRGLELKRDPGRGQF